MKKSPNQGIKSARSLSKLCPAGSATGVVMEKGTTQNQLLRLTGVNIKPVNQVDFEQAQEFFRSRLQEIPEQNQRVWLPFTPEPDRVLIGAKSGNMMVGIACLSKHGETVSVFVDHAFLGGSVFLQLLLSVDVYMAGRQRYNIIVPDIGGYHFLCRISGCKVEQMNAGFISAYRSPVQKTSLSAFMLS